MAVAHAYSPRRRLAWLARRLVNLDGPYLITGPPLDLAVERKVWPALAEVLEARGYHHYAGFGRL